MKTLCIYTEKTIQYNIKEQKPKYLMNIVSMLKPDVVTISLTESATKFLETLNKKQIVYDCIQVVLPDSDFFELLKPIKEIIDDDLFFHVYVVKEDHISFDDQYITDKFGYSKYHSFDHMATILALTTSDYHKEKMNYKLGYFHAMLAKKYAINTENGISFFPAIHFKAAYNLHHMRQYKQAFMMYKQGIVATEQVFLELDQMDKQLMFTYIDDLFTLGKNQSFDLKVSIQKITSLLERTYTDSYMDSYKDLTTIYMKIIPIISNEEDKAFYLKKEYNIRKNHLYEDDWFNRIRFGVICKELGDYTTYHISVYKAHHYYIEAIMMFDIAKKKTDEVQIVLNSCLKALTSLYEDNPDFKKHPIYLQMSY